MASGVSSGVDSGALSIGLGNVNPIDPYGWLLTPSNGIAHDDNSSAGTGSSTPIDASHRMVTTPHVHSTGGMDQQQQFDWEGILQTIGSGWVGESTLEPNLENLFG